MTSTGLKREPAGAILAAVLCFITQGAGAQWELVRGVGAASCLLESGAGDYRLSSTVGEPASSLSGLSGASESVLSGYLSQIPSNTLFFSVLAFEATGSVPSEGALLGASASDPVKLTFSNPVSAELVASDLEIREIADHLGVPVGSTQSISVGAGTDETSVFLNVVGGWKKGSVYAVKYSSRVADINGLALLSGNTRYFSVKMDHLADNVAVAIGDLKTKVNIPAGAYSSDFFVTLSTAQTSQEIEAANRKAAALPGTYSSPVRILSASVSHGAGAPVQPALACAVSFPYADEDGDGLVDGANPPVRVKNLAVWRLDENKRLWVKMTGASLDEQTRQVSLNVSHFSSYALMAAADTDVSTVYAYPVPFKPNAGNSARYGNWTDLITFTSLPSYGKLRIYTIAGDLVRELAIAPPEMKWDVKNSAGEIVASGVYLWEVSSGGNRKTGKLMVVK